jgi:RHS repeat-associated protein
MAIVDTSGTVQKSYTYDVYGKPTAAGSLANEFDFAGQETDPTGLQYLRARYMDPATGRFISREPIARAPGWMANAFVYGLSAPARAVDPSGLYPVDGDDQTRCSSGCWIYTSSEDVGYDLGDSGWWVEFWWRTASERSNTYRACRLVGEYARCTDTDPATAEAWRTALARADAEFQLARIASLARRLAPFASAIDVTFGHGFRHIDDPEAVEKAIEEDVRKRMSISPAKAGQEWREVLNVNGQNIEYRARVVEDGWVNVGTYYEVP